MKNIVFALALLITAVAIAQTSTSVELEEKKMQQALVYGDKTIAISKMYNIIALQGPESTYKDSLAYLYFNKREYLSCFLVSKDVLDRNSDNIEMLEMNTISLESVGAKSKAAEGYQKLLAKSNKSYHAYKLAGLQYEVNKTEDAYVSIKKADQLPDDLAVTVSFQVNANYSQDVSLKASIAYLEGIIAEKLEKKAEAKVSYARAIKLFPEFVLAKSRLSSLNETK